MKAIKLFIVSIISMIIFLPNALAASANIAVTGPSQVVSGNKISVTVTISSSTKIGSWQMNLNYDKNYLKMVSTNSEAGGTMMASYSATGVTKKSYTFTFKTLKTGSTNFSITGALAYAFNDLEPLQLKTTGKTIKIITQAELEASYSKDNYLKSLTIEGFKLDPDFKKDVTEYTVTVPENTKSITINAQENDSRATVSGDGEKTVSAGTNSFDIVVRAENGSEKTYKISVEVKDSNPINVTVDNKEFTVVKIKDYLPEMKSYDEDSVLINDIEIPAYKSSVAGITLVGLKDKAGIIEMFKYEDGKYTPYQEITTEQLLIYPKDTDKKIDGYEKSNVEIRGVTVAGWVKNSKSDYVVIYGIDLISGTEGFWTYDKKNNTLISFDDSYILEKEQYENKINLYSYIIIGYSCILLLLIIIVITKGKKRSKAIVKEEKDENNIKNKKVKK